MNGVDRGDGHGCRFCVSASSQITLFKHQLKTAGQRNAELFVRCQRQQAIIRDLRRRHAQAQSQIVLLRTQIDRLRIALVPTNASNSSIPPSANPPRAPKPVVKKPTGRKIGGQKGHAGHHRKLMDSSQVDELIAHRPGVCVHCQAAFAADQAGLVISRHQVAELPRRAVRVTEHQALRCRCGHCGQSSDGSIPWSIRRLCVGERLSAGISLLSSTVHASRRAAQMVLQELLGCPIALGSISAREAEMSQALQRPHLHLEQQVRQAPVKYVDETGWKGAEQWLWGAACVDGALFKMQGGRDGMALGELLGRKIQGIVCSDRFSVYKMIPPRQRGLCWSHLKRDFQRMLDIGGMAEALGKEGLSICREMFAIFRVFKQNNRLRSWLGRRLRPLRRRMHELLTRHRNSPVPKARSLCRNLLKLERSMWTFARVEGLEPTNNAIERALRPAVIWRKTSLGSFSRGGCRFVERMLSVVQTLRLRKQNVMDYLTAALAAHRQHQTVPPIPAAA
jgi:transposase